MTSNIQRGGDPPQRPGPSGIKRDYRKGKVNNKYSVTDKKKIVELIDAGWKTCDICRLMDIPESSVRNVRKKH